MRDFFGRKKAYCALCDYWYYVGEYRLHIQTALHQGCLKDSAAMARWYAENARLATRSTP